jgi:hypothetical protein
LFQCVAEKKMYCSFVFVCNKYPLIPLHFLGSLEETEEEVEDYFGITSLRKHKTEDDHVNLNKYSIPIDDKIKAILLGMYESDFCFHKNFTIFITDLDEGCIWKHMQFLKEEGHLC